MDEKKTVIEIFGGIASWIASGMVRNYRSGKEKNPASAVKKTKEQPPDTGDAGDT